jgi:hypothetical protein
MKPTSFFFCLSTSSLLAVASTLGAATTNVVGYTSTTLPAGAGNLYAPAFVNEDSFVGTLDGVTVGSTSVLTLSSSVDPGSFDDQDASAGPPATKAYPLYYVEVLNDTSPDGLDTEGLVLDVVSNDANSVTVAADASSLGIQGDEQIAIRKHLTLGDVFSGSSGLTGFADVITIYNEDGAGTAVSHNPDGSGGFFLGNGFFDTETTNAPVYPGTGFVLNAVGEVTIVPTGVVKETPTQVSVFGGSVVNIVAVMKPVTSVSLSSDGALNDAIADFSDVAATYRTDGSLTADVAFNDTGSSFVVANGFFDTPTDPSVDGTFQPVVINALSDTVYKVSGNVIP